MSEITFGPVEDTVTGSVECVEVSLVNDMVTEDTEDFTVTVSSTSENAAIVSPSTATYTIEDDDCKSLLTILSKLQHFSHSCSGVNGGVKLSGG